MGIEDIVNAEERETEEGKEERRSSITYDDSYRNKTHLNVMMTDAEMVPLPEGIFGVHIPETGQSYVNQSLKRDVVQKYRTKTHEQLHKIMQTSSEYVVRTLEAFISGVEGLKNRYIKKPRYIF